MDNIILLLIGILLIVMGLVNITGNISTIYAYNRKHVKEEDILNYGRMVGLGTLVMGIALVMSYFLIQFQTGVNIGFILMPGIMIGLILILYGQFKYNNGIL